MVVGGFEELYRAEWGRLAAALRLVCGDAVTAEELAQEAFVRAYGAWDRVGQLDSPAGWLFATGFNLVRRRWRDDARRRARLAVLAASQPAYGPDPSPDGVDLERAIAALPLAQRKAVVARHVVGMSTEEAAEALGLSPGALRAVLHRGVVALRATRALTLLEED